MAREMSYSRLVAAGRVEHRDDLSVVEVADRHTDIKGVVQQPNAVVYSQFLRIGIAARVDLCQFKIAAGVGLVLVEQIGHSSAVFVHDDRHTLLSAREVKADLERAGFVVAFSLLGQAVEQFLRALGQGEQVALGQVGFQS